MSNKNYFSIEENENGEVWIINNTACHIDGKPFKYKQLDKCRAEMLTNILNELFSYKVHTYEIINKLSNIKYAGTPVYTIDDIMKLI